jgi:hypothetical protein
VSVVTQDTYRIADEVELVDDVPGGKELTTGKRARVVVGNCADSAASRSGLRRPSTSASAWRPRPDRGGLQIIRQRLGLAG